MQEEDVYRYLEDRFVDTFMGELLPGIFHNYANPLNGIMGRSKLMQRRLQDLIEEIRANNPGMDPDMNSRCNKLLSDINAIVDESERFYHLFHVSTGKFYALGARGMDRLNLSALVEAEMGFADFYLHFKHNVAKDIRIDHEMPEISGITAFYSMAIWTLIRQAMKNADTAKGRPFLIATHHDDRWVSVTVSHTGGDVWPGRPAGPSDQGIGADELGRVPDERKDLFCALLLLTLSGKGIDIRQDIEAETLTIRIPRRPAEKEAR